MRATILLLFSLSLIGCRSTHDSLVHKEVSDSVRIEVVTVFETIEKEKTIHIRDTVVVVNPEVALSQTVGCDSSRLETDYSVSDAWIDEVGKLHHQMHNKSSFPVSVPGGVKEATTEINRDHGSKSDIVDRKKETIDSHQKQVIEKSRWLDWFFYPFGVTAFTLIIIYLILLLWKKKLKSMLKLILA